MPPAQIRPRCPARMSRYRPAQIQYRNKTLGTLLGKLTGDCRSLYALFRPSVRPSLPLRTLPTQRSLCRRYQPPYGPTLMVLRTPT
eukprot:1275759-Rhodomonas_salina.2